MFGLSSAILPRTRENFAVTHYVCCEEFGHSYRRNLLTGAHEETLNKLYCDGIDSPKKVRDFMSNLSYNEKVILNLYERFYFEKYPFTSNDDGITTQTHINSQKMCYLLKMHGVNLANFCFTWNFRGPFSPGLLALLRSLDQQKQNAEEYYSKRSGLENKLLLSEDNDKVDELIELLNLRSHKDDLPRWMELLGSLAYLSNSVFPYENDVLIINELIKRKNNFDNREENIEAWHTLEKAKLLKILSVNS